MPTTESATQDALNIIAQMSGKSTSPTAGPPSGGPSGPSGTKTPSSSAQGPQVAPQELFKNLLIPALEGKNPEQAMAGMVAGEAEEAFKRSSQTSQLLADFTRKAIEGSNPQAIESQKKEITSRFGTQAYETAFLAAGEPKIGEALKATTPLEPPHQPRPWEFKDPWGEFWLPTLLGAKPGQIILNNATMRRQTAAMNKQQMANQQQLREYDAIMDAGGTASEVRRDLAAKYGFLSPAFSHLKGLSTQEINAVTWKGMQDKMNDPGTLKTLLDKGLSGPSLAHVMAIIAAGKQIQESNGQVAEPVMKFWTKAMGMERPAMSAEVEQELAAQNIYPSPENIRKTTEQLRLRSAEQKGAEAYASEIGKETALQEISGGRGPIAREAASVRAKRAAEFSMIDKTPISAQDRAKHGIPASVKTYTEYAEQGRRFATPGDRKLYAEFDIIKDKLGDLDTILFGGGKHPGVFTNVGVSAFARAKAQGERAVEQLKGTQLGQDREFYKDILASLTRRLIRLAGESGGRYTDKDVEQVMKGAPGAGDFLDLMDSEPLARQKFDAMIKDLSRITSKMEADIQLRPMGKKKAPGKKPTLRWNELTQTLEDI